MEWWLEASSFLNEDCTFLSLFVFFLSFSFFFLTPLFYFFFSIICKGSCFAFVLLYSRTWNKNISDYDYFFPMYLGGRWEETGKQTQQADHETKRDFKKRRLQEGLMRSLASIGNC